MFPMPTWLDAHAGLLAAAPRVAMFCTGGVRCERFSALVRERFPAADVVQLDGGVHRYLDAFPEDGGLWAGANYTFDKRFSHGAARADVLGRCAGCAAPWQRYQAQAKCTVCRME
jgi:UPF0176 protein